MNAFRTLRSDGEVAVEKGEPIFYGDVHAICHYNTNICDIATIVRNAKARRDGLFLQSRPCDLKGFMISTLAICYLFLGGSGAGALFVLSLLRAARSFRACPYELRVLPRELLVRTWALCVGFIVIGVVCIAIDLGRFDNILVLLSSPQPVPLTVGAYALALSLVFACANAATEIFSGAARISRAAILVLAFSGVACSFVTMAYTGVLLSGMASVVAWQHVLVPILFTLSSTSCGLALVLVAAAFTESRHPHVKAFSWLLKADSILIAIETVSLIIYVAMLGADVRSAVAQQALLTGQLAVPFWLGIVAIGLVAPWALERIVTYSSHHFQMLWIASLLLIGGFMLRWCICALGVYDPSFEFASQIQDASWAFSQ